MVTHHHCLLHDIPDGHEHDVLHLQQPFLHSAAGLRRGDGQGKGNLEGTQPLAGFNYNVEMVREKGTWKEHSR